MEDQLNKFWLLLGRSSDFLGLITVVLSLMTWLIVRRQKRKIMALAASISPPTDWDKYYELYDGKINSENPMALSICLLKDIHSVKKDVENFLLAKFNTKIPVIEILMDGLNGKEDIKKYLNGLRGVKKGALSEATELRLFIAGPVMAGTIAGAVFDHFGVVLLYHKNGPTYEFWGPLVKS